MKVNEKALKGRAISHRTVLGQVKTTKVGQSQVITTKLDSYFRFYVTLSSNINLDISLSSET